MTSIVTVGEHEPIPLGVPFGIALESTSAGEMTPVILGYTDDIIYTSSGLQVEMPPYEMATRYWRRLKKEPKKEFNMKLKIIGD